MEWRYDDNAALALEKYYEYYDEFVEKKKHSEGVKRELANQKKELERSKAELENIEDRLSQLEEYCEKDIEQSIQGFHQDCESGIEALEITYDGKKRELAENRDKAIKENDTLLAERLEQFSGEEIGSEEELGETEKKALGFERSRQEFIKESDERINEYQDGITQETLEYKLETGGWKEEQDALYEKYAPEIDKYESIIDSIYQKYQEEVDACEENLQIKIYERNEEIEEIELKKQYESRTAEEEIDSYRADYKRIEKQYNEQIRKAKFQKRPTTQLQNSKLSQLNKINENITKVSNRMNRTVSKLEQNIDSVRGKHQKYIDKAQQKLDQVIEKRAGELEEPVREQKKYLTERDGFVEELQQKINARVQQNSRKTEELNRRIQQEQRLQTEHHQKIDGEIMEFAMNGETCFDEMLREAYIPFAALESRVTDWKKLLVEIRKAKITEKYTAEYQKQKESLGGRTYEELLKEVEQAGEFEDKVSFLAQNNEVCLTIGGIMGGISAILLVILRVGLKSGTAPAAFVLAAAAVILCAFTLIKTKREFSTICRYIILACEYRDFPGIRDHSVQRTQEKETDQIREIGRRLYEQYYGIESARIAHEAKDKDIKADYQRDLELLHVEFNSEKSELIRKRDKQAGDVRKEARSEKAAHEEQVAEAAKNKKNEEKKIGTIQKMIEEIQSEIDKTEDFMNEFEEQYQWLDRKLEDENWLTPMKGTAVLPGTHGKLSGELYVIREGEKDEYGHKRIFRLEYRKKPLVIMYDISRIDTDNSSLQEEAGKIIQELLFDLMYAVYRMNSRDTYSQIIVDEVGGSEGLKARAVKNAFNIAEVAGKIDEVKDRLKAFWRQREQLAEKGISIDDINEKRFQNQERPRTYNILYLVFKPEERKGKLNEDIARLMPECDKYGFLPIFICERQTWEQESAQPGNMYNEIKKALNNSVILYDAQGYSKY